MDNKKVVIVTIALLAACGPPPTTEIPDVVAGNCSYASRFNDGAPECKEYLGDGWTDEEVASDCTSVEGVLVLDSRCVFANPIGRCVLNGGSNQVTQLLSGGVPDDCASAERGCEVFGGGAWVPDAPCGGANIDDNGDTGNPIFIQPTLQCIEPLDGEPGDGPDGTVCTWLGTQGCTEEGRKFPDYGSCDVVYTQRPAFPTPLNNDISRDDPRLDDPVYKVELDWVKGQIESCSCLCCHSKDSPDGPAIWATDVEGNWANTFYKAGLGFGAGYINSVSFGGYPAEINNGFIRSVSGFASTDPERMKAFFVGEIEHRGLSEADFAEEAPFGGPIYDQIFYEPSACVEGEGIDAAGTMTWRGGRARYVYVLEQGSLSPTVPPGLDLPDGTLWRLDVPAGDEPLRSGEVQYGVTPADLIQRVPEQGAAPALVSGQTYYLYVTIDVALPVTRCLFVAP